MTSNWRDVFQEIKATVDYDIEVCRLNFGIELHNVMKEGELSVYDAALVLDVSKRKIRKFLRGDASPNLDAIVRLCRLSGKSMTIRDKVVSA